MSVGKKERLNNTKRLKIPYSHFLMNIPMCTLCCLLLWCDTSWPRVHRFHGGFPDQMNSISEPNYNLMPLIVDIGVRSFLGKYCYIVSTKHGHQLLSRHWSKKRNWICLYQTPVSMWVSYMPTWNSELVCGRSETYIKAMKRLITPCWMVITFWVKTPGWTVLQCHNMPCNDCLPWII